MPKNNNSTSSKVEKIFCDCGCSDKAKALSNFYRSTREEYESVGGYCTTCKKCLSKSIVDINLNMISKEKFKNVLKKLDKPYVDSLFIEVNDGDGVTKSNFIGMYLKQLNFTKYKDMKFMDSVDIEIEHEKIINSKIETSNEIVVSDKMKRFWGRGLEDQDYIDLQAMFDNFTEHEIEMDYKKQSDYKALCIYELQKSKLQFDVSSIKSVETLQKMIDTLSDNLGIQAIQKQDEFDNNKFILGLIVRYYEDVKKDYIGRWVEDLGKIDPLRDILKTDYLAGMANALGVNNKEIEEANARMEEFSVKLEEYYEKEDED